MYFLSLGVLQWVRQSTWPPRSSGTNVVVFRPQRLWSHLHILFLRSLLEPRLLTFTFQRHFPHRPGVNSMDDISVLGTSLFPSDFLHVGKVALGTDGSCFVSNVHSFQRWGVLSLRRRFCCAHKHLPRPIHSRKLWVSTPFFVPESTVSFC